MEGMTNIFVAPIGPPTVSLPTYPEGWCLVTNIAETPIAVSQNGKDIILQPGDSAEFDGDVWHVTKAA